MTKFGFFIFSDSTLQIFIEVRLSVLIVAHRCLECTCTVNSWSLAVTDIFNVLYERFLRRYFDAACFTLVVIARQQLFLPPSFHSVIQPTTHTSLTTFNITHDN